MLGTINNSTAAAWRNWELYSHTKLHIFILFPLLSNQRRFYFLFFQYNRGLVKLNISICKYQRYLLSLKIDLISEQTDWWVR